jgi:hypothetical protein
MGVDYQMRLVVGWTFIYDYFVSTFDLASLVAEGKSCAFLCEHVKSLISTDYRMALHCFSCNFAEGCSDHEKVFCISMDDSRTDELKARDIQMWQLENEDQIQTFRKRFDLDPVAVSAMLHVF